MKDSEKIIKILYDISFLSWCCGNGRKNARRGTFYVAYNLLKVLMQRSDVKIYLYSDNTKLAQTFLNDYASEIKNMELFSGDIKDLDVFFSARNKIPEEIRATGIPCSILLHDCIPIVLKEYKTQNNWFLEIFNSLTAQDICFANSEYTKKDFIKYHPELADENFTVIPLSTNREYQPNKDKKILTATLEKYHIPQNKKYLFSLCSLEPRKNLIRAVRSFIQFIEKNKLNDIVYVLGGGAYEGFIEQFEQEVSEYKEYKDKIIRAGYIDDEDLEILYSNAQWFVYTSEYEGFGMPPLEAMRCGCPVITSNNTSLPEVVGDAGQMIDWDSDEQHIAAYEKYYFDDKFRQTMAQKGVERSKTFSWDKAAEIIVNKLKELPYNKPRTSLIIKNSRKKICTKISVLGLPLIKINKKAGKTIWKILGIPVLKKRQMENGITTKYYLLGLKIIKVSRKECS